MDYTDWLVNLLEPSRWTGAMVTRWRIVAIVLAASVLMHMPQRLIRLFRERITRNLQDPEDVKRAQTLRRVFRYVAAVV